MRTVNLDASDNELREKLAVIAHAAAAEHFPRWLPTLKDARAEVDDASADGHIARVLLGSDGEPRGFISGVHVYGKTWEIHPLVIAPEHHGKGHGRLLVTELESMASARGAGVIIVGTADETKATSLSNDDLWDDPIKALAEMKVKAGHPVGFWLHIGYSLVGVTPDAEGRGMPSINLAKRPPPANLADPQ